MQVDKDNSDCVAELRTKELSLRQIQEIKKKDSETKKIDARKECGLKESVNYLMSLPCDLYK